MSLERTSQTRFAREGTVRIAHQTKAAPTQRVLKQEVTRNEALSSNKTRRIAKRAVDECLGPLEEDVEVSAAQNARWKSDGRETVKIPASMLQRVMDGAIQQMSESRVKSCELLFPLPFPSSAGDSTHLRVLALQKGPDSAVSETSACKPQPLRILTCALPAPALVH